MTKCKCPKCGSDDIAENLQPVKDEECICGDIPKYHGPEGMVCTECMHMAVEEGRANYGEFDPL